MAGTPLRSDKFTAAANQTIIYSDFTRNLDVHPNTGDLFRITNSNSVKNALKNLILTNKYERFYAPTCGGNLSKDLFENMDPISLQDIQKNIQDTIEQWEPRVNLLSVVLTPYQDSDAVDVTVVYNLANVPQPETLTLTLERVR